MGIKVSVIVPTCERTELLKRCLTALCNQDFDKNQYEIIVVDDAGSPETKLQIFLNFVSHRMLMQSRSISSLINLLSAFGSW